MSDPAATPREHKATAPTTIGCWVLTISDSKTPETDTSGTLIAIFPVTDKTVMQSTLRLEDEAGTEEKSGKHYARDRPLPVPCVSALPMSSGKSSTARRIFVKASSVLPISA